MVVKVFLTLNECQYYQNDVEVLLRRLEMMEQVQPLNQRNKFVSSKLKVDYEC